MTNALLSPPTARATLSRLQPLHAAAMYRWMLDPEVAENLGLRSEPTLERTQRWIESALGDPSVAPFAIEWDGRHVGNVVLDRIDAYLSSTRLSIYVGEPSARGRGIGKLALRAALDEAFAVRALNKVWLTVHESNARAIAAYVAVGFRVEGVLRDEFVLRGQRCAALSMSVLAREYHSAPSR